MPSLLRARHADERAPIRPCERSGEVYLSTTYSKHLQYSRRWRLSASDCDSASGTDTIVKNGFGLPQNDSITYYQADPTHEQHRARTHFLDVSRGGRRIHSKSVLPLVRRLGRPIQPSRLAPSCRAVSTCSRTPRAVLASTFSSPTCCLRTEAHSCHRTR